MLLGKRFEAFIESSPVSVMIQGIFERTVGAGDLDRLFDETAEVQYSKQLLFSQCVQMMSDVVFRIEPSVGSWYEEQNDDSWSDNANGSRGLKETLLQFHGEKLREPQRPEFNSLGEYTDWHHREVFKGRSRHGAKSDGS